MRRRLLWSAFIASCTLALIVSVAPPAFAQGYVALRGSTRPEANRHNDRGRVADGFRMEHMLLLLQRSPAQEQALDTFIAQLHDPNSPNFHHWLTASEFGRQFGVDEAQLAQVTGWLQAAGFAVNLVYPNRMLIDFSGTAGQVRQAFHTEIHQLKVRGKPHIANMSDPEIPAYLASIVKGVVSLNDFRPYSNYRARPRARMAKGFDTFGGCGPLTAYRDGASNCALVTPADLATIYDFKALFAAGITGKGQTIAVIEPEDMYSAGDWNTFRKVTGLARAYPYGRLLQTHPAGSGANNCTNPGDPSDTGDIEVTLDAEWASAAAPNATIEVASCENTETTSGDVLALENILNGPPPYPSTISSSWGQGEPLAGAAANAAYYDTDQQGVAQGVSIFVAAGDSGAAESNDHYFYSTYGISENAAASTPYDVAVGGTDFSDAYSGTQSTYWNSTNTGSYGSATSYIPEIPWDSSCADPLVIQFVQTYISSSLSSGYGPSGYGTCNTLSVPTESGGSIPLYFLDNDTAGAGGPSNCATGAPTTPGAPASGGTCAGWPKPSWQSILGNPADGVRDLPDVSLMAANGLWNHYYVVCISNPKEKEYGTGCGTSIGDWWGGGGTSFAAPIWAGIQALVDQYTGQAWGNPDPAYYEIANAEYGSNGNASCNSSLGSGVGSDCTFYDVTEGSNEVPCAALDIGDSETPPDRLFNCYSPSVSASYVDADYYPDDFAIGVLSAATETYPAVGGPGPVTNLNVTFPIWTGSVAPPCSLSGGGGSGATCNTSVSQGVDGLVVTSQGSGYLPSDILNCAFIGGGGAGATCQAYVDATNTVQVYMVSPGSGYTSTPACLITGGSGTGVACSTEIEHYLTGMSITSGGSGYTSNPTCNVGGYPCWAAINGVTRLQEAYPATVGWDFATGIGTVNVYNLVHSTYWTNGSSATDEVSAAR